MFFNRSIKLVFIAIITLLLINCGSSSSSNPTIRKPDLPTDELFGSIRLTGTEVDDASFEGANARILGLNQYVEILQGKSTDLRSLSEQGRVLEDNVIRIPVISNKLDTGKLYIVEVSCSEQMLNTHCPIKTPLHVVLSKEQLLSGHWHVTLLTEMVYQQIAYYVLAEYDHEDMEQTLNLLASQLTEQDINQDNQISYEDILLWNPEFPTMMNAFKKPDVVYTIIERFKTDDTLPNNELKTLAQRLFSPKILSFNEIATPEALAQSGSLLYAVSDRKFFVIDATDPSQATVRSSVAFNGKAKSITISDGFAYITKGEEGDDSRGINKGIEIYSVENPDQPTLITSIADDDDILLEGSAIRESHPLHIAIADQQAFIIDGRLGLLKVFDIPEPGKLEPTQQIALPGIATNIAVNGVMLSMSLGQNGAAIYDIRKLASGPEVAMSTPGMATSIQTAGNYAYVLDKQLATTRIYIYEHTNNTFPKLTNIINLPGEDAGALQLADDKLYVSTDLGLLVIDVADPLQPRTTHFESSNYGETIAIPKGRYVFLGVDNQLSAIDIGQQPTPIITGSLPTPEYLRNLTLTENKAYFTSGDAGVVIADVSNPKAPNMKSIIDIDAVAHAAAISNQYAYIASMTHGLIWFDTVEADRLSRNVKPELFAIDNQGDFIWDIAAYDNETSFLIDGGATNGSAVVILDTIIPADPKPLPPTNELMNIQTALSIDIDGEFAFVGGGSSDTVYILDLKNPRQPQLISSVKWEDTVSIAYSANSLLYVGGFTNRVTIYDVRQPSAPKFKSTLELDSYVSSVAVAGSYLYVGSNNGISVFDVSTPEAPTTIGRIQTLGGSPKAIEPKNGLLYCATNYGLEIFRAIANP